MNKFNAGRHIRIANKDTRVFFGSTRIGRSFNGTNISYDGGKIVGRESEFRVSSNRKKKTGGFHLVKLRFNGVLGGPFAVGSHEEVTAVDFENAGKNEFRKIRPAFFRDQDIAPHGFVVCKII